MGKESKISWTDASFNPWWGCVKVSPACTRCYAETFSKRVGKSVWGKDAPRRFFGDKHWNEPLKWQKAALKEGVRKKVFCASMADWLEERDDLVEPLARLLELIAATQNLDWLLLSKRVGSWADRMRQVIKKTHGAGSTLASFWLDGNPMKNVWMGATTENQLRANDLIPQLFMIPASIRWLSVEPMLGLLNLRRFLPHDNLHGRRSDYPEAIDWVIVGGESGHGARPMDAVWVRNLLDQCKDAGTAFHFKQKGNVLAKSMHCASMKGDDPKEWPQWMRIQEFPKVEAKD